MGCTKPLQSWKPQCLQGTSTSSKLVFGYTVGLNMCPYLQEINATEGTAPLAKLPLDVASIYYAACHLWPLHQSSSMAFVGTTLVLDNVLIVFAMSPLMQMRHSLQLASPNPAQGMLRRR